MIAPSSPTAVGSLSSRAPEPARDRRAAAAPTLRLSPSWLAAQGRLPLAFMGLALAWLAVATALVLAEPATLAAAHLHPHTVALTHAWVLGFFVTVACGAMYQLGPVALGTTLAHERRAWWHLGLHAVGVPGMVYAFRAGNLALVGHFGSFVALGIVLCAENMWRTVHRSTRRGPVAWSLALATGWLLLTVLAGLTLAANRLWYFIPLDPIALLRAHAHLGLAGFFLTLLQGVTFQLLPMFTLGEVPDWRPVRVGLWLSQLGLLGLAPALAWHAGFLSVACGVLIVAGMAASGVALVQTLGKRKKRALDPGVGAFLHGAAILVVAAGAGILLAWPASPWGSAPGGFNASVYGVLLLLGGLLPAIAGMLCKIVPFLTWMRAYGPKIGRGPTPSAGALASPRLERWALTLQASAVVPFVAGVWREDATWLQIGAGLLAAGVMLFLAAMLGVLKHLWRPVVPAAAAPTRTP